MTEHMTLAKALRYKKRVIEAIRQLETDIQTNNSKGEGEEREIDVLTAMKTRSSFVEHLVELKSLIQEKTRPIQYLILQLAEAKSEISFIQKLDVTHGLSRGRWETTPVKYEAIIRKSERDKMVKDLQKKIDDIQSKIDMHNAATTLEIETPELP